jgi:hypothetical protein
MQHGSLGCILSSWCGAYSLEGNTKTGLRLVDVYFENCEEGSGPIYSITRSVCNVV